MKYIILLMEKKNQHIFSCFTSFLEGKNILAIWRDTDLSLADGIDIFYGILDDAHDTAGSSTLTKPFLMSVEATKKIGDITEIYYGDMEYHIPLKVNDDTIYVDDGIDVSLLSQDMVPSRPPRDDKGYYAVKSLASSILAERHGWYEECFDRLRPRAENENDTLFGTCQMLFYMHDNLPPETVLDWFRHDTPLMRQLRHSSPFAYAAARAPHGEYDELVFDIVNNPEKYPPLPSHQIWLESILAKGGNHINDFTKRFIPQDRLPQN